MLDPTIAPAETDGTARRVVGTGPTVTAAELVAVELRDGSSLKMGNRVVVGTAGMDPRPALVGADGRAATVVVIEPTPALTVRPFVGMAALPVPEPALTVRPFVGRAALPVPEPALTLTRTDVAALPAVGVVAAPPPMATPMDADGLELIAAPSETVGRAARSMPAGVVEALALTPTDSNGVADGFMTDGLATVGLATLGFMTEVTPPRLAAIPVPAADGCPGRPTPTLTVAEGLVAVATDALTVRPRPDEGVQVGTAVFEPLPAGMVVAPEPAERSAPVLMLTPTEADGFVPRDATEAPALMRGEPADDA